MVGTRSFCCWDKFSSSTTGWGTSVDSPAARAAWSIAFAKSMGGASDWEAASWVSDSARLACGADSLSDEETGNSDGLCSASLHICRCNSAILPSFAAFILSAPSTSRAPPTSSAPPISPIARCSPEGSITATLSSSRTEGLLATPSARPAVWVPAGRSGEANSTATDSSETVGAESF